MANADSHQPDVDVVIVSWNSKAFISECIESVLSSHAEKYRIGRTLIVDNASADGSADWVADRFGDAVTVVRNARNEGFGAACNLGASLGHAKYVLFLNPDAELGQRSVEHAVCFLDDPRNAQVGACGVRLVDRAGVSARSCARRPTARMFLATALGLHRLLDSPAWTYVMADFDHETDQFVDHVIGAMYLVRRPLFERLGGFDPRFFVYLEDLDLSMRIRDSGSSIAFLAQEPVFHEGGGASKAVLDKRLFYSLDSRLRYAAKHFSMGGAALVWCATLFAEPLIRVGVAVVLGRVSEIAHTSRAYRWLFASVLGLLQPRDVSEKASGG